MRKEKPLNKEAMIKAFKCIDTNGDGFITYDELFAMLTKVCLLYGYCDVMFILSIKFYLLL